MQSKRQDVNFSLKIIHLFGEKFNGELSYKWSKFLKHISTKEAYLWLNIRLQIDNFFI